MAGDPVDVQQLAESQAALRRIAAVAAAGSPPETVFDTVTSEASVLLGGALVALTRFEGNGSGAVVVARTGGHVAVGARLPVTGETTLARLWRTGRTERMDSYVDGPGTNLIQRLGIRAGVSVPVTVDGALWGALGLSSRTGPLPADTEHRLTAFVEIVAAAAASAEARESARVLAAEQTALLRVAALVARGAGAVEIFDAVAEEAAGLIDDEATTLVRYEGDRTFLVLAHRHGPAPVGMRFTVPTDDAGTLDQMMRTLKPARLDRYDAIADRSFSKQNFGVGSSVSVPVVVDGRLWGALGTLNEGRRLPEETERRLGKFAELVASALANVAARAELERFGAEQAARRRVAELVARGAALGEVFEAVATEASNILDETSANLFRYDPDGLATIVAVCRSPSPLGARIPTDASGVRHTGGPVRVTRMAGTAWHDAALSTGVTALVAVPVVVEGRVWGGLATTTSGSPPPADTEDRLAAVRRAGRRGDRERREPGEAASLPGAGRGGRRRDAAVAAARRARRRPAATRPDGARAEARSGRGGPGRRPGRPRAGGARARRARDGGAARHRPRHPPGLADPRRTSCRYRLAGRHVRDCRRRRHGCSTSRTASGRDRGHGLLRRRRGPDERRQARAGDAGAGHRRPATRTRSSSRSPTTGSGAPMRGAAPA